MRHTNDVNSARSRKPHVGILIETTYGYGREMLLGFMQYANAVNRWRYVIVGQPTAEDLPRLHFLSGAAVLAHNDGLMRMCEEAQIPVVNLSNSFEQPGVPTVSLDARQVGREAASYLISKGYRSLLACTWAMNHRDRTRIEGFSEVADATGCTMRVLDVSGLVGGSGWKRLGDRLLKLPKPIGAFIDGDTNGRLLLQCAAEVGLLVPEQMAVISHNNDVLECETAYPTLSSIDCRLQEIGYRAAELLDAMMRGEASPKQPILVPPGEVVERRSTSIFAVDNHRLATALAYMQEHACDPAHVADVVKILKLNRRWLERSFRQHMHCTPHAYLNQIRLDRARQMLRQTQLTIPDIAERSGFGYEPNLRRAFIERYHQTPAQFRRSLHGKM